jgi:hypothetical protein
MTRRAVSFQTKGSKKKGTSETRLRREGEGRRDHDQGGNDDLVGPELPDGEDTVVIIFLEGSVGVRGLFDDLEEEQGGGGRRW